MCWFICLIVSKCYVSFAGAGAVLRRKRTQLVAMRCVWGPKRGGRMESRNEVNEIKNKNWEAKSVRERQKWKIDGRSKHKQEKWKKNNRVSGKKWRKRWANVALHVRRRNKGSQTLRRRRRRMNGARRQSPSHYKEMAHSPTHRLTRKKCHCNTNTFERYTPQHKQLMSIGHQRASYLGERTEFVASVRQFEYTQAELPCTNEACACRVGKVDALASQAQREQRNASQRRAKKSTLFVAN